MPLELDFTGSCGENAFNLGRNALAALVQARGYRRAAVPRFICGSVYAALRETGAEILYYPLDHQLEPVWNEIPCADAVLYVDYFGLKDRAVELAAERVGTRLIADLTQAFFYRPADGVEGFNSVRKFIGAPDGAFLFSDAVRAEQFSRQEIGAGALHLILRADGQVEEGYPFFKEFGTLQREWGIRRISRFSEAVLLSADLDRIARKRREHFRRLDEVFCGVNQMKWGYDNAAPLCYPLLLPNGAEMKKKLIAEKIFVPTYWPGLDDVILPGSAEENFVRNFVCLPVDQHLTGGDIERMIDCVTGLLE